MAQKTSSYVRAKSSISKDQGATDAFFAQEKPDYAFLSAAKTGGIAVNISQPAQFLHENVLIAANTIHSAHRYGVKKLIFIGSANAYMQDSLQPMSTGSFSGSIVELHY